MTDRILEILKQKNLSPSQFADEIGIQRSGMSHIISGRNKPSLEFVLKVLKRFPEIKSDWLLNGEISETINPQEEIFPKTVHEGSLFDEVEIAPKKEMKRNIEIPKKEKSNKKIEKVIILFQDKTFREYDPE
ncbi:MAG: helix-turn-helix transcriptional regulator [Bacteroidales bacterium]|nr:helix-turn-helix transcriptional regulator [Bacteroidales bacterium]